MTAAPSVMLETSLDLELLHSAKVRDLYALGDDRLLLVATDRISAFDVVLPNGLPRKGEVLTRISEFWFQRTTEVVPNAFIAVLDASNAAGLGVDCGPEYYGRSMVMHRAEVLKVEAVVRGYIAGSGWSEYQQSGTVCGNELPAGLLKSSQLLEAIFTPSTKAEPPEHDAPMTYEETETLLGSEVANAVRLRSLALYRYGSHHAAQRGILVADTKFEFGMLNGEVTLIDEVMTPDSSRFWPQDKYIPGVDQPSFDKQPLRDYLDGLDWDKTAPGPALPDDIVDAMSARYLEAYRLITSADLPA